MKKIEQIFFFMQNHSHGLIRDKPDEDVLQISQSENFENGHL